MNYIVKTHILKHFDYGEIIYPINGGQQYAKLNPFPGDDCLSVDFIERNPTYFEAVIDNVKVIGGLKIFVSTEVPKDEIWVIGADKSKGKQIIKLS